MTTPDNIFNVEIISRGLPAVSLIASSTKALTSSAGNLVIQSPPGTGKTTVIPPLVSNVISQYPGIYPEQGPVLVTAPRRVAVRAAARRLATLDGTALGDKVGYSVRGDHIQGSHVQFLTPGILLRKLLNDPELTGYSAVIIDEVHERQLDTDLLVGMLAELSEMRDDFSLIAMSATLDSQKFASLLNAKVLNAQAPTFPITTIYSPSPTPRLGTRGVERGFVEHIAQVTHDAIREHKASALVFMPGVREIEALVEKLSTMGNNLVIPLHGRLTAQEQDRALAPSDQPRIVVSTSVAESSLTVPGVRIVVDSGLSRTPRRDAARGLTGLITTSCAQSSADQRAGRAGREGPGTVVRCYGAEDYAHFAQFPTPEIQSADLTQAALWLTHWGTEISQLPLPTQPPETALMAALTTLSALGAKDIDGITALGKRLSTLPLTPQFGASLLHFGTQAAPILATLSENPRGNVEKQPTSASVKRETARLAKIAPPSTGHASAGQIIGTALPHLIARKESDSDYLLASGTRAQLTGRDLAGHPWLAVADINRSGHRALIRAGAAISEKDALAILGTRTETHAKVVNGKVQARLVKMAGNIELSSTPTKASPDDVAQAISLAISEQGLDLFTFSDKARSLADRLGFLHKHIGAPWPDIKSVDPHVWLGPELEAISRGTHISKLDMYPALQRLLPWPEASNLNNLAPAQLEVPSGRTHRIDYLEDRPVVRVKLQECFGLVVSPKFCGIFVQFHLLSPAGRPLAVTDDLASFWSGPYAHVRAEMRGRYPKHPWPEDPRTAIATSRIKKKI